MSVVNVKVSNIRPQYNNLEDWVKDENNIYVGRRGIVFINGERFPKKDSLWANPYKVNKIQTREEVLEKYDKYIRHKIVHDDLFEELIKLKDKNLGCWCSPQLCHGDILIKLIEEYSNKNL